ncbi:MAG: glycosyl hydrolase, partial [Candidatus Aminicenantes bacterium]|nr:glycosyl hydrolase [Candidatus Aminicenantes bacterium]
MRRKFSLASLVAVLILLGPVSVPAQGRAPGKAKMPAAAPLDAAEILKTLDYRSIGPTQQSGRFVDFAVPLQRPNTFYAAAASGGLWKTENNGQTFDPLFENEKVFSIGDVAVAPANPDILWLGSGEANNSRSTYWGDGIYKSADAGKTWRNMGLKESHHIGRVVINPANPDIVYVAALGHLYSENSERG